MKRAGSYRAPIVKFLAGLLLFLMLPLLLVELSIRAALFTPYLPIAPLREATLYAGYSDDDDFWKLLYCLDGGTYPDSRAIHPVLGWSQTSPTPENRLGLSDDTRAKMKSPKRKILFYGDSFVNGASSPEYWLPVYMTKHLRRTDVVDLSVGGYGFDQTYLMFRLANKAARSNDAVLVGVMLEDIDRSILNSRSYQKPRFTVRSDKLLLTNVPIEPDAKRYKREHPPEIRSYLFAALRRIWARHDPALAEKLSRITEKREVNRRIIERFKEEGSNLEFVIFHAAPDLGSAETWQAIFLKEQLSRLRVPYIDTKPVLEGYAQTNHIAYSSFYVPNNGHHNDLGNRVIGDALVREIEAKGFGDPSVPAH